MTLSLMSSGAKVSSRTDMISYPFLIQGGKELPHSYKYERLKNKNERSLSIYNVEESDLGMYTVKARF